MLTKLWEKLLLMSILVVCTPFVQATILEPNPTGSNEDHWNAILGAGSFDDYSNTMRGIPIVFLLIATAWTIFGLFRAGFIECSITKVDFAIYASRMLLIVTISITLIVTKSEI